MHLNGPSIAHRVVVITATRNGRISSTPQNDRRRAMRYQLNLTLKFTAATTAGDVRTGFGETRDLSSHAVRFTANIPIPTGSTIELLIDWPRTGSDEPLILRTVGRVVRSRSGNVVALIRRYLLAPASGNLSKTLPRPWLIDDPAAEDLNDDSEK